MSGFAPHVVDKVERLLDLLDELGRHPALRGKLALHGGTAINLFMLDVPRLSVDIDVSYIGAVDRDEMLADRPVAERSISEVARAQGYSVSGGEGGHAGRTFVLLSVDLPAKQHVRFLLGVCIRFARSWSRRGTGALARLRRCRLYGDSQLSTG